MGKLRDYWILNERILLGAAQPGFIPLGYDVALVLDGKEALRKVKAGGIALILLDIMMPGKDGYEAIKNCLMPSIEGE
ncbi:MAG: response regulator [Proteobacteria bacterium]|nr:response regulator [Pseudomonadota bacterium]MBU1687078.1 response regulator [Pseudomonadota bacterium]